MLAGNNFTEDFTADLPLGISAIVSVAFPSFFHFSMRKIFKK